MIATVWPAASGVVSVTVLVATLTLKPAYGSTAPSTTTESCSAVASVFVRWKSDVEAPMVVNVSVLPVAR